MRALIAITCSRLTGGAWSTYSLGHFMDYTYSEYSQAILHWGGAPVIIPTAQDRESLETILSAARGLILTGGPDVHPRNYGEEPIAGLGQVDEQVDRMELEAARLAIERDLPLLAICRGIQVLNVALGGTLFQDISLQAPNGILHAPNTDKGVNTHTVRLTEGCRLQRLFGRSEIWVNGKHHQAIKDLAPGLSISARARDGIIEAVEYPGKRFAVGVQWHPDGTWRDDPHSQKLFSSFMDSTSS